MNFKCSMQALGLTIAGLGGLLAATPAQAFTAVTSITVAPLSTSGSPTTVNGITYNNQSLQITSLSTASNTWNAAGGLSTTLTLRRSTAGTANQIVWSERAGSNQNNVRIAAPTTTQAALNQNNIFMGTDNLFTNNSGTNRSNVERVDFVTSSGFTATSDLGVVVFERGATTGHDKFKIAAITGVDASGNATSFGNLLSIAEGWGQTNLRTAAQNPAGANPAYTILNGGTAGAGNFTNTSSVTQNIGGVVIQLSELVSGTPTIYGYALFAHDTNVNGSCTAAGLVNIDNTNCYKTNTADANGGIDLLAANVGIVSNRPAAVPVPPQLLGTVVSALVAAGKVRSSKKKNNSVVEA
jgi:hypothetical protein